MKKKFLRLGRALGVVGAAFVMALFVAAPPAQAAGPWKVNEGADYVTVGTSDKNAAICDMEEDGNGVYGLFFFNNGNSTGKIWDTNGSAAPCAYPPAFADTIFVARVCEDDFGTDTCNGMYTD